MCHRGKREVVKTKGLRPLIRMHLARRGGHRAEKKIPTKDIDGHVQNLRVGLSEEDLKFRKKPGKWVETTKAGGEQRNYSVTQLGDASQPTKLEALTMNTPPLPAIWRDTVLPGDFSTFNFTQVEEDARLLTCIGDSWVQERGSTPTHVLCDTVSTVLQDLIDGWLHDHHPTLSTVIAASIRMTMLEGQSLNVDSDVALFESIFKRALIGLVDNGSRQDGQLARSELLALEKGKQGVGRTIIDV